MVKGLHEGVRAGQLAEPPRIRPAGSAADQKGAPGGGRSGGELVPLVVQQATEGALAAGELCKRCQAKKKVE